MSKTQTVAPTSNEDAPESAESTSPVTETTAPETPAVEAPAPKPKAVKLTLSQRRALLRLQADGAVVPPTAFNELPFLYLTEHGLARQEEGVGYVLTDAGAARAASVNPGYLAWKAGGSVKGGAFRPAAPVAVEIPVGMQSAVRG